MANIQQTDEGVSIQFTTNKPLLGSKSSPGINFGVNNMPDVFLALTTNAPFPSREITLGTITAKASAGDKDVVFGKGSKTASFSGSASAYSGFGVYPDPRRLLRALGLDDDISPGLELTADPASHFVTLRWGYGMKAAGKGGIIFGGAGSASIGLDGKSEGIMAIIRRLPKTTGAATAIATTVDSWLLPLQISSPDALPPGTWIVSEVDSAITVGANVQFGLDFNWVKEAQAAGLSGDIGLRLELGAKAAASFQAGGKFAVVVSRDSADEQDQKIRIRLFKQRRKGWNFASSAQGSIAGKLDDFLPEEYDEFINAVFGVHAAQILKDLQAVEDWTDPRKDLPGMLAGLGAKYFFPFLKDTTGIDPENAFEQAKAKLKELLDKWHELDHTLAAFIWKQVDKKANLKKIVAFNKKLKNADDAKVKAFLQEKIADVRFFQTPEGQFLLAMLPEEYLLSLLTDSATFQKLKSAAQQAATILDGGPMLDMLAKLQDNISKRLNLQKLEQVVNDASFDDLDEWLKLKLASFLDDKLKLSRMDELRRTINTLVAKRGEFYKKVREALSKQYAYGFNAAFQKNTTSDALIDLSFDAAKGRVGPLIRQALLGNFDKILTKKQPAVTLHAASLTHGIRQQSNVTLNLPFFKGSSTHLNECLARMDAIDEEDGRVFLYDVDAEDVVAKKNKMASALSIGGHFRVKGNAVQVHNSKALSYAYSFAQYRKGLRAADLGFQLKPYIDAYLPMAFTPTSATDTVAGLGDWIADLEREVERLEPNGAGVFGNTLLKIELTLPPQIASAWLLAPEDKKAPAYMEMSKNIQGRLKELIPYFFFQDPENFKTHLPAYVLLAYSAIYPANAISVRNGRITEENSDVYWDWKSRDEQEAMLGNAKTLANLRNKLQSVSDYLKTRPGLEREAESYHPDRLNSIISDVMDSIKPGRNLPHLESLLKVEADIVHGAWEAGRDLAEFVRKSKDEPGKAVKKLAEFGAGITKAFNRDFRSIYGGDAIRPLSTLVFINAAASFLPLEVNVKPGALFDLVVLRQNADLQLEGKLRLDQLRSKDILVHKQFIELGAAEH